MKKRGSIYRKYVTLVVALVGGALIVSGIASMYRSYIETRAALIAVEREQAVSASIRIENFVKDIERQIGWTSLPQVVATTDPLQARRYEYLKLLQQVPAVTEATYIDANGREQVRVSRIAMNVVGSGDDLSADPRFTVVNQGHTYFGPVYFRQETEPYMAIAVCAGRIAQCAGRRPGGVTAVQVNLKFIWEVVQRIGVGKTGFAYVVDRQGRLVAHPDISLVLQKTDLSRLPQVAAALAHKADGDAQPPRVSEARDRKGRPVLTAFASIESLGWSVFVEQSIDEAYAPLYASLLRTGGLLVIGLLLSMVAGIVFARRMVNPIRALQAGADALGAGDLTRRIEVRTGDELEALGERFNEMAGRLAASYAGLERKVEERTQELQDTLEQQTATAEILRSISSSPSDVTPVFEAILDSAARLCDSPLSGVFRHEDGIVHLVSHRNWSPSAIDGDAKRLSGAAQCEVNERPNDPRGDLATGGRRAIRSRLRPFGRVRGRLAADARCADQARRSGAWRGRSRLAGAGQDARTTGAATGDLRRPGRDRDRECAPVQRDQGGARAADRHRRDPARDLRVADRCAPVFETILDSAARLCDSPLSRCSATTANSVHLVSHRNWSSPSDRRDEGVTIPVRPNFADDQRADDPSRGAAGGGGRAVRFELRPDGCRTGGWRRMLGVPIKRGDKVLGAVIVGWPTPGKTPERQMRLLETFADQAAIAIENVRLFNETNEALEQQKASAEVLGVISGSVADTQPVFDKILASCNRLFSGHDVGINVVGEDGADPPCGLRRAQKGGAGAHFPVPLSAESGSGLAILERKVLHYPDIASGLGARVRKTRQRDYGQQIPAFRADALGRKRHRRNPCRTRLRWRIFREGNRPAAHVRRPGRDRDPECAPVPRNRGQEPPARDRQQAQVGFPRQHVARVAHAAQRDHRLFGGPAREDVRRGER